MATFFDLQSQNRRRTNIVVVMFLCFFIWLGLGLDLALWYKSGHDLGRGRNYGTAADTSYAPVEHHRSRHPFRPTFAVIVGLAGAAIAAYQLTSGASGLLQSVGATAVGGEAGGEERMFRNVVEEMSLAAGIPVPQVWVVPDDAPNAFACGVKDGDYHVAATRGLLCMLNRDEIQGVVAHEIAHLKNHDTRLMTTLAVLVGLVGIMSDLLVRCLGSFTGGGREDGEDSGGILIQMVWVVSLVVAPFAAFFMSMFISREREYLADASAAQFTRNPGALASALAKIGGVAQPSGGTFPATARSFVLQALPPPTSRTARICSPLIHRS